MSIKENLSENLKKYKLEKDMTLEGFAEFLHISRSALQNYLAGEGNPGIDTLEHMADRLEISVYELIGAPREEKKDMEKIKEMLLKLIKWAGLEEV